MNEKINWVCVYKTSNLFEAEVVKGNIESAEIPCVIVNKQDSSYLSFGYVEVHVPATLAKAADLVLNNNIEQN
ncbi:MAG: DUF2007 domain-containing protein [Bacteroidetes bacterium]|nr:DUF2007 domain-containing protein [Bacteroidota bacterium]MBK8145932.1 DUF2007 domain-containing protein [Bacteroidota bacterium]MBP6314718.1 DUF2007 domain-containing protein [Chitinophagaceae bacterium]